MDWGRAVRQLRSERGMTLRSMAKAAAVDFSYIGKVEHGVYEPSHGMLAKIARAGGLSYVELMLLASEPEDFEPGSGVTYADDVELDHRLALARGGKVP